MKTFLKSLKRDSGFTLVELMVVVAIIGLLSAVAIPNFKKYQAKSKISEAKLQLSAIYTAEQSFFSDFNIYGVCLPYMGFDPTVERLNRYFAVGFPSGGTIDTTAYTAAVNSGLDSTAATGCPMTNGGSQGLTTATTRSPNPSSWFDAGKGIGAAMASTGTYLDNTGFGDQSSTSTMTFTAGAGGVISSEFTSESDASLLRINERKILTLDRNGY